MKIVFRSVLTLSLATLVLLAPSFLRAAPDASSKNTPAAKEGDNLGGPFRLNKDNAINVSIETVTNNKEVVRESLYPTFAAGDKAVKAVIAHPENANSLELATAAAGVLRAGDLEEAGFLIFAAQLRELQDLESYPPADKNQTVSTTALLGMVIGCVRGDVVTRELQFQPKVLVNVVKRLDALQLKEPADYKPGWDYTKHAVKPGLFAENKANMLAELKPVSELLLMPDYFAALKCYSDFSELSPEAQKQPANAKSRDQAVTTMKRIEKEKNLHGVMYQVDRTEVN
jgi:hypothetical protein